MSGTGLPGVQRPKREDDDGAGDGDGDFRRLVDGVVVLGVRTPLEGVVRLELCYNSHCSTC